uniref:Uncharacterized protein n=1 Tax=Romanomermis culicivorax TaxID=13658 RepID=A0A915KGL2_ROMCU
MQPKKSLWNFLQEAFPHEKFFTGTRIENLISQAMEGAKLETRPFTRLKMYRLRHELAFWLNIHLMRNTMFYNEEFVQRIEVLLRKAVRIQ